MLTALPLTANDETVPPPLVAFAPVCDEGGAIEAGGCDPGDHDGLPLGETVGRGGCNCDDVGGADGPVGSSNSGRTCRPGHIGGKLLRAGHNNSDDGGINGDGDAPRGGAAPSAATRDQQAQQNRETAYRPPEFAVSSAKPHAIASAKNPISIQQAGHLLNLPVHPAAA